ncbi:hypothetical protein [Pseudofulvibacter geojedonensis]|uniref:MotA/TolQ/ExbB proton channel domain-containing protein n=1 Tax=Pseudofulvibacter geojedonensis TaxID=1123758 RepID=A0ABW3I4N8_9FLAO
MALSFYKINQNQEYLLIPCLIFSFVVGSIFFHVEYLKEKKNQVYTTKKRKVKLIYWVLNSLSALTFTGSGLILAYLMQTDPPNDFNLVLIMNSIIYLILFLGVVSFIDMFFVYKFLKKSQLDVSVEIDKIGS